MGDMPEYRVYINLDVCLNVSAEERNAAHSEAWQKALEINKILKNNKELRVIDVTTKHVDAFPEIGACHG